MIDGDERDWASESGAFLRAHCDRVCGHEVEWFGETRPGRLLAWQFDLRARAYELCECTEMNI